MSEVFLDTGHVVALANPRDEYHRKAHELARHVSKKNVQIVTTQDVLVEVGNALAAVPSRSFASAYIKSVEHTSTFEVVGASASLFQRGSKLYREREDKSWGLTDCISFVVMRDRGVRDALAHDSDFEQAGFNALLRA